MSDNGGPTRAIVFGGIVSAIGLGYAIWTAIRDESENPWPWWLPLVLAIVIVVGILAIVLGVTFRKMGRSHDLEATVRAQRPGFHMVTGFTIAEMADWQSTLPFQLPLGRDAGTIVVVVNTSSAYEIWTNQVPERPTWLFRKAPHSAIREARGRLMGRETQALMISDDRAAIAFVPSYSGIQLDDRNGSVEWINQALWDLGAA